MPAPRRPPMSGPPSYDDSNFPPLGGPPGLPLLPGTLHLGPPPFGAVPHTQLPPAQRVTPPRHQTKPGRPPLSQPRPPEFALPARQKPLTIRPPPPTAPHVLRPPPPAPPIGSNAFHPSLYHIPSLQEQLGGGPPFSGWMGPGPGPGPPPGGGPPPGWAQNGPPFPHQPPPGWVMMMVPVPPMGGGPPWMPPPNIYPSWNGAGPGNAGGHPPRPLHTELAGDPILWQQSLQIQQRNTPPQSFVPTQMYSGGTFPQTGWSAGPVQSSPPAPKAPSTSPTASPTHARSVFQRTGSGPSTFEAVNSTPPPAEPLAPPILPAETGGQPATRSLRPPVHPFWLSIIAPAPGQAVAAVVRPHAVAIMAPKALNGSAIAAETSRKAKEKLEREKREARGKLLPPSSASNATATDGPVLARITVDDHASSSPDLSSKSSPLPSATSTAATSPAERHASSEKNTFIEAKSTARKLDRYVEPFIPAFLHAVQSHHPEYLHPLKATDPFPAPDYPEAFLPKPCLTPIELAKPSDFLLFQPPIEKEVQLLPKLDKDTYSDRWKTLLGWELEALGVTLGELVLWKMQLDVVDLNAGIFKATCPGIREGHPKVEVGDVVILREVFLDLGEGGLDGFQGRVVAVRKREGFLHIEVPSLFATLMSGPPYRPSGRQIAMRVFMADMPNSKTLPTHFNLTFKLNAEPSVTMSDAVVIVQKALDASTGESGKDDLARRWLFPEVNNLALEDGSKTPMGRPIEWVDGNLNDEQKTAVTAIATSSSRVPYLISGPFGTGKTKSVVEAVLQILRCQPDATILLCAPSNSATDTLALRLVKTLVEPGLLLRLNDKERTFAEVPAELLRYCCIDDTRFGIPSFKELMSYRVILCSCLDAAILTRARVSNRDLGRLEAETVAAVHRYKSGVEPHWTHLLIDEAGQGSEPELLVPISVVLPHRGGQASTREPQLVLCGDAQQLGAIVTSDHARSGELDVSLLERLFDRPIYSLKNNTFHPRPFTNLVKNYRCHPALLMTPSSLFYHDTLEPAATNGTIGWSALPNPDLPFVFWNTVSDEEMVDEKASWYNQGEASTIVAICQSLLSESSSSSPPLKVTDIGVMTPFREQVWRVREALRKEKMASVDVGSVEDYQGRESRITIVSTVRSRARFLDEDKKKGMGIVFEQKRFNVAITRAKELLVIVGNAKLLSKDPYWNALLSFALRNKLMAGQPLDLSQDRLAEAGNTYMSRLESDYRRDRDRSRRKHARGKVDAGQDETEDEDEAGAALSGAMAREAMREDA